MKKITAIIAFAAAVCTLTSCGNNITVSTEMSSADPGSSAVSTIAAVSETSPQPTEETEPELNTEEAASAETDVSETGTEEAEGTVSQSDSSERFEIKNGTSEGNVYISDYAGIKLTLPETAHFLDEADLYTHYMMPTRFMSPEDKDFYLTGILDASASYSEDTDSVKMADVWFYDTKLRYPETPDISPEEFIRRSELELTDIEVTDVSGPEEVTISGVSYCKASYNAFSQHHISYARRIDDEHIMVIRTSGFSAEDIESRIESLR